MPKGEKKNARIYDAQREMENDNSKFKRIERPANKR
jgi:hypothetical protein